MQSGEPQGRARQVHGSIGKFGLAIGCYHAMKVLFLRLFKSKHLGGLYV